MQRSRQLLAISRQHVISLRSSEILHSPPATSFEMKTTRRSKLEGIEMPARQPLTNSTPRSPKIKTPKTPSAKHVLITTVQNSTIKTPSLTPDT
jgi:hypothetical protein